MSAHHVSLDPLERLDLNSLAAMARERNLRLAIRAPRRLGVWGLQVAVARPLGEGRAQLLGELKGWALPRLDGLQLDTMRVQGEGSQGVGTLIWAACFAWALEATPCRSANLLAIRDGEQQHRRLVRYFRRLGFEAVRELGAAPADLPVRLIWGGSGLLMRGDCAEGLKRCAERLGSGGAHP